MSNNQISLNNQYSPCDIVKFSSTSQIKNNEQSKLDKKEETHESRLIMKGLVAAGIIASSVLLVRSGKVKSIIAKLNEANVDSKAFATKVERLWRNKKLTYAKNVTINRNGYFVDKNTHKRFTGRTCEDSLKGVKILDVKDGVPTKSWSLVWDETKHSYRCTEMANIQYDPQKYAKAQSKKS